jgi:GTP-binding protein LepA
LVVDASQGVEAQTLANAYLAIENNLEILPVVNKIDLPSARVDEVKKEIEDVIGLPSDNIPCISAKEGLNIEDVLKAVVENVPSPSGDDQKPLKALIFDSFYDNFKGAISLIRVFDGSVKAGDKILMMATGKTFDVTEVGIFTPSMQQTQTLNAGEVGYLVGSIKNVADTHPEGGICHGYATFPWTMSSEFILQQFRFHDILKVFVPHDLLDRCTWSQ